MSAVVTRRKVAAVTPLERLIQATTREALSAWSYFEKSAGTDPAALVELQRTMKLLGKLIRLR